MNRKNLTAAVLAGLAGAVGIVGSAQAVNINPDGLGQVLLYPYYTVNGGNLTVLSVVNTTEEAKAVKVRFLEGENSREVLDFNLYMSKYDVWTAALIVAESEAVDADGDLLFPGKMVPTMLTGDTSCTVPYIYGNGGSQEFLPWALTDAEYLDYTWKDKQSKEYGDISRGAEGHFEMIEMGTLVNDTTDNEDWVNVKDFPFCVTDSVVEYGNPSGGCTAPTGVPIDRDWTADELAEPKTFTTEGSATAATHKNGVPKDCQQLVDAWTENLTSKKDGYWITDPGVDMDDPSGGMFGGAAIVNVNAGTMYSYDAKAIDGFATRVDAEDFLHQEPGTILPSLDSGNVMTGTVFVGGEAMDSTNSDGVPSMYTNMHRGVDAVSFVLMHDAIMNEYTTEVAVGASTEWVITFPTKQFYVHQAFLDEYEDRFRDGSGNGYYDDVPLAPFTSTWTWKQTTYVEDASGNDTAEVKKAGKVLRPCEVVGLDSIYDREERTIVPEDAPPGTPIPPIVSPAPPVDPGDDPDAIPKLELCYETSVIAFGAVDDMGDTSSILGSSNFHNIDNVTDLGFSYGWARLNLADASEDVKGDGNLVDIQRPELGGLIGLPVTGFAVNRFENSFLGEGADTLANYGGIFQHKGTRSLGSSAMNY